MRSYKPRSWKTGAGGSRLKADVASARAGKMAAVRGGYATRRRRRSLAALEVEKKFYDTSGGPTALTAPTDCTGGEYDPSATSMISTPAVGDSEQNRDGKKIVINSVQVKGIVYNVPAELSANPPAQCNVFVALVLDTQSNGAQLNSEDVYKNTLANANTAASPTRNLLFGSRFKVLKSETFDLSAHTLSHFAVDSFSYSGKGCTFEWFVPLNLTVNFNAGTTSSIANVIDNSLHIIAFASSTSTTPTLAYNARIRFVG